MSIESFAVKRTGQQDRAIDRLAPLAATWLDDFGSDDALGDLVDAATEVWLDIFEAAAPQAYVDKVVGDFRDMLGTYLTKTTEPEADHAAQTRRVAVWLATVATNDATWHGFQASGGLRMRWVSRKDERVRNSHRAANGQIRSVTGAFDVGGAELRYPGDPRGPLAEVMECRCVLAPAGRVRTRRSGLQASAEYDVPETEEMEMTDTIDIEAEDELTEIPEDVDLTDEPFVDEPLIEIPVHGVATIQGKPTGDGRMFAPGALSNRPLPLPLRYEFVGTHGGDTSMVAPVGRLDELWLHPTAEEGVEEYRYRGVIITTKQYANEAIEGIADGSLTGVSVETDDITVDVSAEREEFIRRLKEDRDRQSEAVVVEDGEPAAMSDEDIESLVDAFIGDGTAPLTVFSSARVCGFTIVPIPAFHEGYIALGHEFMDELSEEDQAALVACGCYQPEDGDDASVIRGEDAWSDTSGPGAYTVLRENEDGTKRIGSWHTREEAQAWIDAEGGDGEFTIERATDFREVSGEERKKLADEGKAMPDGSFPIANEDDLRNAIQAIGRAKDPEAAKAHIKKRAAALGKSDLIPEGWSLDLTGYSDEQIEEFFSLDVTERDAWLVAAAFAPGTKDGPGWITHPRATARIRRYWVTGKGAAKIAWGTPGDFNRCRSQLAKYVQNPDWLAGLCANMHKEALGIWPGEHHSARGMTASGVARATKIDAMVRLVEPEPVSVPRAIVAAASWPAAFDSSLFENPGLTEETPITFDGDRVYGHIATWNSCHIGMDGMCMNPPASRSDYAYFRKGVLDTDEGPLAVGCLTFGTGHIGERATAHQATAHYDKPDKVRAYVVTGEDAIGIWFSGVVRPGLSRDEINEFRALGAISGDWRWVKNDLELVGVTAVSVNGFQLARKSALVAAAFGHQITLLPAPVVTEAGRAALTASAAASEPTIQIKPSDLAALGRIAAQEVLHQQEIAPRIARVREVRAQEHASRIARVRAVRGE